MQAENIPRGYVVVKGQDLSLDDLTRMQRYCGDCLLMENCGSASAVDAAVKAGAAPGSIEHLVYAARPDAHHAKPKLICLKYENVTHAHR